MREILFRGKRKDNGEWMQGSLFAECSRIEIVRGTCNNVGIEGVEVIPETIGQYTGLTDKNGKKIFEGDILKSVMWWCDEEKNGLVTFKDGAFGFIWYRGTVKMFHAFTSVCNIEYEVIGNIHDNPELLGDK